MKILSFILVGCFFLSCQTFAQAQTKLQIIEDYRVQGLAAQEKGLYDDALAYFQKALVLDLERADIYNDLGVLSELKGSYYEAKNYYEEALRVDKHYLPTYFNLGFYYKRQGDLFKATFYFKERIDRSHPDDPWVKESLDQLRTLVPFFPDLKRWMQEYEASFLEYRRLEIEQHLKDEQERKQAENIKQSDQHLQQAKVYEEHEMYEHALAQYDLALARIPESPRIQEYRRLAVRKLKERDIKKLMTSGFEKFQAGHTSSSKEDFRQILSLIPDE